MNVVTSGHVNLSPVQVMADDVSLAQVLSRLKEELYGEPPGQGWSAVLRPGLTDVETSMRRNPGSPAITELFGGEVLLARRMVDRYSYALARRFDEELLEAGVDAALTHQLLATDFLIYGSNNGFTALCATHSEADKDVAVRSLAAAMRTASEEDPDEENDVSVIDPHPRFATVPDLFLWLMYRSSTDSELSDELELLGIRFVRAHNSLRQRSDFRDSASLDRAELLAIIAQQGAEFGSAKFILLHKKLDLEVDMQLSLNGSYSPFIGSSWYRNEVVQPAHLGIRLALDCARTVLPDLYRAHAADTEWLSESATFRSNARSQIASLLS